MGTAEHNIIGRLVGVDYGQRRIGIAISDTQRRFAAPADTIEARGSAARDAELLLDWARKNDAVGFVVGLPLNMDGSVGPQARKSQALVRELQARGAALVELWDERLSSFQADEWMNQAELSREQQIARRDALAATAILQAYLDTKASR